MNWRPWPPVLMARFQTMMVRTGLTILAELQEGGIVTFAAPVWYPCQFMWMASWTSAGVLSRQGCPQCWGGAFLLEVNLNLGWDYVCGGKTLFENKTASTVLMFHVEQPNFTLVFISGFNKLLPSLQENIGFAVFWTSDFSNAFNSGRCEYELQGFFLMKMISRSLNNDMNHI